MSRAIYILGGMGPQATGELYSSLIENAQTFYGATHNNDYPEVTIHSIPVPDFIAVKSKKIQALNMLVDRVKAISEKQYGIIAIACNTAHLLLPELRQHTTIPFVSMIDETAKAISQTAPRRVALIATPTTIKTRLYQSALSVYKIETLLPNHNQLAILESIIRKVIAGKSSMQDKSKLAKIIFSLKSRGADSVIVGCTELSVLYGSSEETVVSSLDVLSKALLKKYYLS